MRQKANTLISRAAMMLLMMLLTTMTAWAAENTTFPLTNGQTWTNTTTNTRYTVSGEAGNLTLTVSVADPSVNDGTGYIANEAFMDKNMGDVKTIAIDAGITSIGEYAFVTYPQNYTIVTFAENSQLTTIAKGAFESCENLTSINLGDCLMLESIGDYAFYNCTGLTTLDLSGCTLLTSIGRMAFANCTNLTITIPKGLTIGSSAFTYVKEVNQVGITLDGLTYNETDDCFDIGSLTELQAFLTYANDVGHTSQCKNLTFRLTDDIDMTGQTYKPIPLFRGTFNGNSKTITGLAGSNGLFECIEIGGSVTDLTLSGVSISEEGSHIGAIAGYCIGVIERCHVTGSVNGLYGIGGIAGYLIMNSTIVKTNPHISGCTFSGTVTGVNFVGGICGYGHRAIQDCTVSGSTITGTRYVGGIMGVYDIDGVADYDISGCTVAGVTVEAEEYYGLILGYVDPSIPNASAIIHDNYYSVEAGEGVTITYQSGDKKTIGDTDYYKTGATLTLGHTDREGYVFGGYETTPADIIVNGTLTMPEANVTVNATWAAPDDISVSADGKTYTIHTAEGWNVFCDMLAAYDGKTFFTGKTVKLGADIEVTRMAGSSQHDFTGTFDGQGHTLTVSYNTSEQYAAPFRNAQSGCVIENLHVAGTIATSSQNAAGIISNQFGSVTIRNCRSSVTIESSVGGDGTHGGIVAVKGNSNSAHLTIEGCVFDGKIVSIGSTATIKCGGFVGWRKDIGSLTIKNCLYAPQFDDNAVTDGATFARNGGTISNCYYTQALGDTQGSEGILLFDSGVPATANEGVISRCASKQYDVKLWNRTLYKDGAWNTLCLPFDVVLEGSPLDGDGVDVRTLDTSGFGGGTLTLNFTPASGEGAVTAMEAGRPYIIKWNATGQHLTESDLVFTGVTVSSTAADVSTEWVDFCGTYSPEIIYEVGDEKHNLYLGEDNGLYYPDVEGFALKSCRAYFQLKGGLTCGTPAAHVRAFNLNFFGEDDATGIISTTRFVEDPLTAKGGNFTNSTNGDSAEWYSLDGRRLSAQPTRKGLYIVNGRKVVIK